MGAPDQVDDFVRLQAGDLTIYLARDIWDRLKPRQSKLLMGVSGYGRFWLHLSLAHTMTKRGDLNLTTLEG